MCRQSLLGKEIYFDMRIHYCTTLSRKAPPLPISQSCTNEDRVGIYSNNIMQLLFHLRTNILIMSAQGSLLSKDKRHALASSIKQARSLCTLKISNEYLHFTVRLISDKEHVCRDPPRQNITRGQNKQQRKKWSQLC